MTQWRMIVLLVACCCGGVVFAQQAPDQPPPVIFRSEVNYVELDATVTDAQGNVLPDLTQADFEVLEDGKVQKVSTFAHIDLPIEKAERPLFASTPIEPDVQTNRAIEGRVYLIVLDDLHTALARTPRVKRTVRQFIETALGVNDVAAVVYTGRNDASQDFTSNPRLLLDAVDKFTGRKLRSPTLNQLDGANADPTTGQVLAGPDIDKPERSYRARAVMGSIRKLSEFMAGVHGRRKAMLWFGEGIDYDVNQAMGADGSTASIVLEDIRNAVAAAQRGNVTIYAIDPRGLFDAGDDLIEAGGLTDDLGNPTAAMQAEVRNAQDSLRQVSVDTGGFSVLNTNEFGNAFDRIIRENSSYYLLGYYSTNDKRDGRLRKLQIRVKRPGVTVRSRTSYVAPSGKASPPVDVKPDAPPAVVADALASPLPVSGVPMRMYVGAFKGTAPNAAIAVALEIDASHFDFVNRNGAWIEEVNVLTTAMNAAGKSFPGERQKLTLTLKPETYQRVVKNGLRVVMQIDLPPGRYQLRVAAGNASTAGSVLYDLEVPDFSKGSIALSGIALTSMQAANDLGTIRSKNPLGDYLPGPPIATRDFHEGDTLTLFSEVYENGSSGQAHQVGIKTELRNDVGKVVAQASESRSSTELQGKSGGYGFTSDLPLIGIAPGLYVLHVEAQSQTQGLPTASRDIQLRVIP
jgi:VWFA-related protein